VAYNIFVAYDLDQPGQNYDAVRAAIRGLGQWHQFQLSLFYVHTAMTPQAAYDRVWASMDSNDKLAVINCADQVGAVVSNWDQPLLANIAAVWFQP
jgi:hypothetical protein